MENGTRNTQHAGAAREDARPTQRGLELGAWSFSGAWMLELGAYKNVPLNAQTWFPDPRQADRRGLVAVGGELSVERLLAAYRQGIFPWTVDPVTWWSPDPRAIFELDRFHVPKSLEKTIRRGMFQITHDRAFRQVMEGCAAPAPGRRSTWITPEFMEAYTRMRAAGHAHSVECWRDGELAGGIYGVRIGGFFAG